jgi:hypothetical protein
MDSTAPAGDMQVMDMMITDLSVYPDAPMAKAHQLAIMAAGLVRGSSALARKRLLFA